MRYLNIIAIILLLLSVSCNSPVIDTSTEDSMQKSIAEVRSSLPESKQSEFDEAIAVIAFGQFGSKDIENRMKEALHGKTGHEVLAEADRILKERKERERTQALNEIKELEEKKAQAEQDKKDILKFEILRSRFYLEESFIGKKPIIELTVKNNTAHAVSRAYFEGTLASPGRTIPWVKQAFNYSIPGGLEPGEEASWTLAPNMFSEWGTVDVPADAVLTVTVEKLDGPDDKVIYSSKGYTEYDEMRMQKLKDRYLME